MTKTFKIWVEGYAATGNRGEAQLAGTVKADSLKDAATQFFKGKEETWGRFDPDRMTVWGCRIFDNEADARKSYG